MKIIERKHREAVEKLAAQPGHALHDRAWLGLGLGSGLGLGLGLGLVLTALPTWSKAVEAAGSSA